MSLKSYVDITGLGHFKDRILVDAIIESGTGANITETNKAPSVKATYDYIDDLVNNPNTGLIAALNQAVSSKLSSVQYDSTNKKITATNGGTKDVVTVDTIRSDMATFGASGSNHKKGLVPDPGSTAGTSKFLREDATWAVVSTTDTKNTAGATDTSSKIYIIGATSQDANPQTYSHDTAYVGTDGCLYSDGQKVLTQHQDISGKANASEAGYSLAVNGTSVSLKNKAGTVLSTITTQDTNTTYESKSAASGGTAVSLVTTGEKYTWNNKGSYSKPSGGIPKTDLASDVQTSLGKADTAIQSHQDISGKLDKLTYEWNKNINFGASGKLLIGKFPCYDTNVTVDIDATTSQTYHGTLVLATQNINTSGGGSISAKVYGDSSGTIASKLYLEFKNGSNAIAIYFSPEGWSKNLVHIRASALASDATDVCTNVDSIPGTATIRPTNDNDELVRYDDSELGSVVLTNADRLNGYASSDFQMALTFDNVPTANSNNPVKSSGIHTALAGKQNTLTFDSAPTANSNNPVKSGGIYTALAGKQNTLTFDDVPTANSNNPVKSGGVYTAIKTWNYLGKITTKGSAGALILPSDWTELYACHTVTGGFTFVFTILRDSLSESLSDGSIIVFRQGFYVNSSDWARSHLGYTYSTRELQVVDSQKNGSNMLKECTVYYKT